MSALTVRLENIHIENFLSLHQVDLPLKPLTVLVGPNASGKSNALKALELIKEMVVSEIFPPVGYVENILWAGGAQRTNFVLHITAQAQTAHYKVELQPGFDTRIASEELVIQGVKVISVQSGKGSVKDENGENEIKFASKKLALKSAGDYGNKPITNALTNFVRGWEFYDIQPDVIRADRNRLLIGEIMIGDELMTENESTHGTFVYRLLDWYRHDHERFEAVCAELKESSGIGIALQSNGEDELYLLEGYEKAIPLNRASDGTLRLLAYHVLLNSPELPSLIAIEEPERNLHPAVLKQIGDLLERLAERTQVIVTTHSSQLLDSFDPANLENRLEILLLSNPPGQGTQVMSLHQVQTDRAAIQGWMAEFGIGSAIFDSQLLQDILAES
jgi:predicted ATPase